MTELIDRDKAIEIAEQYRDAWGEGNNPICGLVVDDIRALPAVDGWRSIDSAPRDGGVIMLASDSPLWKYPFPGKWCNKQQWWIFADEWMNDALTVSDLVSHWQPANLPNPPAEALEVDNARTYNGHPISDLAKSGTYHPGDDA